ncbi:MAG: hypothetical protein QM699_01020 [Amaricoccus sp.]
MFCEPIWRWFIERAQSQGLLPDGVEILAEWGPPKFESVNPLQDAQADILEVRAGFRRAAAWTAAAVSPGAASGVAGSVSARGSKVFIGKSSGERKRASPPALSLGPDGLKPVPATLSLSLPFLTWTISWTIFCNGNAGRIQRSVCDARVCQRGEGAAHRTGEACRSRR